MKVTSTRKGASMIENSNHSSRLKLFTPVPPSSGAACGAMSSAAPAACGASAAWTSPTESAPNAPMISAAATSAGALRRANAHSVEQIVIAGGSSPRPIRRRYSSAPSAVSASICS